jgi:hypothetical protein
MPVLLVLRNCGTYPFFTCLTIYVDREYELLLEFGRPDGSARSVGAKRDGAYVNVKSSSPSSSGQKFCIVPGPTSRTTILDMFSVPSSQ